MVKQYSCLVYFLWFQRFRVIDLFKQKLYSQTCLQRSATGNNKSGLCWQVAVVPKQ